MTDISDIDGKTVHTDIVRTTESHMSDMIDVGIDGMTVRVTRGQSEHVLPDGRKLVMQWGETNPPSLIGHYIELQDRPTMTALDHLVQQVALLAGRVADCNALEPRDRNAVIGQLRAVAGQLRGLAGLPGFRQAPFAPTTSAK